MYIEDLVIKSENGQSHDWRRRQRDTLQMQSIEHIGTNRDTIHTHI